MISPDVAEGDEEGGRGREFLSPGSLTTPPRRGARLPLTFRVLGRCQPPHRLTRPPTNHQCSRPSFLGALFSSRARNPRPPRS